MFFLILMFLGRKIFEHVLLLSCSAMDPTVLPIDSFCGRLVACISGELHLPLLYYPSLD
ncbi:hypothetical protein DEO72_LG5g343 [Vigna unguiculata]|uniref:Uncharacterized protein n=1 Tax=Vigna unguiculata TaxID=3917 RepID=A0A4D6LV24_VIGUN|nr:hypothetical protein DEO72_LG5g343 [Vigna unguiculata]